MRRAGSGRCVPSTAHTGQSWQIMHVDYSTTHLWTCADGSGLPGRHSGLSALAVTLTGRRRAACLTDLGRAGNPQKNAILGAPPARGVQHLRVTDCEASMLAGSTRLAVLE